MVFPAPRKTHSDGGVELPQSAQRPEIVGTIVEIGEDVPAGKLSVGDVVLFPQFAGVRIELEDENGEEQEVLIMDYVNIVAKVD